MVVHALRVRKVWVRFPVPRPKNVTGRGCAQSEFDSRRSDLLWFDTRQECVKLFCLKTQNMKFAINHTSDNAVTILRRLGYIFQRQDGDEMSFVRPLAQAGYPRFHCYVKTESGKYVVSIHLDQKRETYGKNTRHHGEYENDGAVKEEVERIQTTLGSVTILT